MAEAFGLAASVLSVASLAIQLGDSLQKAYEFWESVEDGPDDIHRISSELRFLANVFHSIPHEGHSGVQEHLVKGALELAKKDIDELADLVSELARAIGPDQTRMKRRWGRVKIVLKGGTITKMRGYIESSKNILILLEASRTQSAICQMNGKLDMLAATFSNQPGPYMTIGACPPSPPPPYQLLLQPDTTSLIRSSREISDLSWDTTESHAGSFHNRIQTKTSMRTIDAGLGMMTLRSTSASVTNVRGDTEEQGMRKTLSTNNTFDSWSFNTIWKRPSESHIFQLCKTGNAVGVDEILRYGNGSVFDADPDGATPLHYACKYGHSTLARLLIERGADIYARTDIGNAPIEDLEEYDRHQDVKNRKDIAKIVDTMIRYANFDPFDWEDPTKSFDTLTLWNGLPYENLNYLFAMNNSYATPEQRFDFILGNILQLRESIESNQECIDLLLVEYEKLRSTTKAHDGWRYNFTLLQHLVFHWLDRSEGLGRGAGLKVSRALKLTNDLWRRDREGTVLDTVARYDANMVDKWLDLLSENGIDLYEYGQFEQARHADGIIDQGPDACCRIIEVNFAFGEIEELNIDVHNTCDPRFQHLDPQYRCEASRRRELCISQMDDAFIGDDGKPLPSIPGSWMTTLKPNSELPITLKFYEHGWQYTDFLEAPYKLWDGTDYERNVSLGSKSPSEDGSGSSAADDETKEPVELGEGVCKEGKIDKGPTQKSPRSGCDAPVKNCRAGTPKSKSPCSGKEAPQNALHSNTEVPTQKSPHSGKEAPSDKSPASGKNGICHDVDVNPLYCADEIPKLLGCNKVPCLKKAYESQILPVVGSICIT